MSREAVDDLGLEAGVLAVAVIKGTVALSLGAPSPCTEVKRWTPSGTFETVTNRAEA
jgi:hypothetical protein